MRAAVLVLLAAFAGGCDGGGTAERLSSSETLDGVDVPAIGTVGDFPDPAHRHVVNVTADGRIVVEGKDVSFENLVAAMSRWDALSDAWFSELGDPLSARADDRTVRLSGEHVVFRLDGRLPMAATRRVLETCVDKARIFRIWLAVRHEGDGVEGAVGFPMLLAGGGMDMGGSVRVGLPTVKATAARDAADGSPQRLFEVLRAVGKVKAGKFDAYLDVDRSLPTSTWLSLWDACVRAKPAGLYLWWSIDRQPEPFAAAVARRVDAPAAYSITLFGMEVPADVDTSPMPAVARRRGPATTIRGWNYEPYGGPTTVITKPLPK
jgi:hypothetical protein